VRLLTGATVWRLHPLEQVGLRSVVISDERARDDRPGRGEAHPLPHVKMPA